MLYITLRRKQLYTKTAIYSFNYNNNKEVEQKLGVVEVPHLHM